MILELITLWEQQFTGSLSCVVARSEQSVPNLEEILASIGEETGRCNEKTVQVYR